VGERVEFVGHVAEPAPFYRRFDIFALSSDTEQMPLSVLEAMATGLVVMSTDVGDVRDMLGDEAAGVIAPLDAGDDYVDIMRALLTNPELRRSGGAGNRRRVVEQFGQDVMVGRYRDIFHETLRG
jgi:glycosyltransferase involved in cell wall biosynthesis